MSRIRNGLLLAVVAIVAALTLGRAPGAVADACPTANSPNTLTLVGGTPQTAKLHQPFDEMLQVALANTNGCSITTDEAGVPITFAAPSGGATGTFSASGSNTVTVGANASGQASAPGFTANGSAGSYTVTASSDYGTVSFSLTNTASGIAATIAPDSPTSQSATTGSHYPNALRATVLDANGSPIDGATVAFTLGSGSAAGGAGAGASFDGGGSQATELTDATGTATSPLFSANSTAGAFTATAATAGVVEPAGYTLDNLAGTPPTIAPLPPMTQSARIGARFGKPLQVKVLDAGGKPLQGASITFTLGSGTGSGGAGGSGGASAGASFLDGSSQTTAVTDASGIATSPSFTANSTPGRFAATATMAGSNDAASFALDNLAGKGPSVAVVGNKKRSTVVGAAYAKTLQVKVRDGSGKPLQGASVTFTLGAGAAGTGAAGADASFVGAGNQATETTNAAGVATSPRLVADTTAGTFTATATTTGTTTAATFLLHNLAGAPVAITAGVAATESTTAGTRFPVRLAVTVADKDGNPVAGVHVGFSAPARGASGHFDGKKRTVEVRTDAKGVAVAPPFVANRIGGGYVVRATAAGRSAAFALVNQPAG
jgi:protocatechuate 3,4-dioxygenase beta subunit